MPLPRRCQGHSVASTHHTFKQSATIEHSDPIEYSTTITQSTSVAQSPHLMPKVSPDFSVLALDTYQTRPSTMDYQQLREDQAAAFAQSQPKRMSEKLPAYSEALKAGARQPSTVLDEKKQASDERRSSNTRSSTFKSILTGDVQKHNPRLRLGEHLDRSSVSSPSASSSLKKDRSSSTFKSILTGDVQKHNSRLRLSEHLDNASSKRSVGT